MDTYIDESFVPSVETLQHYYNFVSSDDGDYWALKDEYLHYNFPRTYLISPPKAEVRTQWSCLYMDCERVCFRKADLERHMKVVHNPDPPLYDCPMTRCSRKAEDGFTRQGHLREHLRNVHKMKVPKRNEKTSENSPESQK